MINTKKLMTTLLTALLMIFLLSCSKYYAATQNNTNYAHVVVYNSLGMCVYSGRDVYYYNKGMLVINGGTYDAGSYWWTIDTEETRKVKDLL